MTDNGRGFHPHHVAQHSEGLDPRHIGLDTMTERVLMAGGTIDVRSAPGEGTKVAFQVPLARSDLDAQASD